MAVGHPRPIFSYEPPIKAMKDFVLNKYRALAKKGEKPLVP
jgi:hypothetical protein